MNICFVNYAGAHSIPVEPYERQLSRKELEALLPSRPSRLLGKRRFRKTIQNANRPQTKAGSRLMAKSRATFLGPFGEPLRVSGAIAAQNPFRFSTKYADDETGLVYYGYRYYNPSTGRWINRDPIEENGGINICAFAHNDLCDWVDFLGLAGARACNYDIIFGHGMPRGPSDQRNVLNRIFANQFPGDAATGVGCFNGNINSATNQIPGGMEVWEDPNIPLMNRNGTHNIDQPGYLKDIDYNEVLKSKIVAAQTQAEKAGDDNNTCYKTIRVKVTFTSGDLKSLTDPSLANYNNTYTLQSKQWQNPPIK